jgi:hypothetical protein
MHFEWQVGAGVSPHLSGLSLPQLDAALMCIWGSL